ncbi:hypothetical protein, partial [Methylicorpusculum sp.]|uniref:hypothetical protein n=1 Tax=Methylicorpusculum sp. TaxID=2713644 RepID=UPI0027327007
AVDQTGQKVLADHPITNNDQCRCVTHRKPRICCIEKRKNLNFGQKKGVRPREKNHVTRTPLPQNHNRSDKELCLN